MKNIAKRLKALYESEDFALMYLDVLRDDLENVNYSSEGTYIKQEIRRIAYNVPEFKEMYGTYIDEIQDWAMDLIIAHILDNLSDFYNSYSGYFYPMPGAITTVSFGEQEEQLTGLNNPRTNKPYNLKYLIRIFEQEDYTINKSKNDTLAYYNLSDHGLYIDMIAQRIPILDMLANNRLLRYLQIDVIAANLKEWAASDTDEWMECDTVDDNYREHHYADLAGGHLGQYIAGYICQCFDLWDLLPEGSVKKSASSDYPLVDCDAWNDMDMQLSIWMDEINTYILHEDSGYFNVPENVTLNIGYWEPDSSYVLYFRETTY